MSKEQTLQATPTRRPSSLGPVLRKRSYSYWLGGGLVAALALGALVGYRLSVAPEPEAVTNLLPVLQQHTQSKYAAALVVVEADAIAMLSERRVRTHTVLPGETIASIAQVYQLRPQSVALSNPGSGLQSGQKLLIPPVDGLVYRVRTRDTLASIAAQHRVSAVAIAKASGPGFPDFLTNGQLVVIPGNPESLQPEREPSVLDGLGALVQPPTQIALSVPKIRGLSKEGYLWPARGYVGSPYGPRGSRMHMGIDIVGPAGTPVLAARSGLITFAGWMSGGFGNAIDIRHADGTISRYSHLSRVLARSGQTVETGQAVGATGCTGRCTGPHLHFELHIGGRAVNPLPYLK